MLCFWIPTFCFCIMLMYLMLYRFNLFCQFVSFIYQKSNVQNIDLKKVYTVQTCQGWCNLIVFFLFSSLAFFWSLFGRAQRKDAANTRQRMLTTWGKEEELRGGSWMSWTRTHRGFWWQRRVVGAGWDAGRWSTVAAPKGSSQNRKKWSCCLFFHSDLKVM